MLFIPVTENKDGDGRFTEKGTEEND